MMQSKKINCWAKALGDCGDIQSKEHIVSKSLVRENLSLEKFTMVYGIGFEGTKKIGLSSLSSKMLCVYHNNKLSNLDLEASKAFRGLRNTLEIIWNIKQGIEIKETLPVLELDGLLLERWFLKTTINILWCPPHNLKNPSRELVEIVFGLRKYPEKVGLCMVACQNGQWFNNDFDLKFVPLLNSRNEYEIVVFEFAGWRFALPLTDSPIPSSISLNPKNPYVPFKRLLQDLSKSTFAYHLKEITLKIGNNVTMRTLFHW